MLLKTDLQRYATTDAIRDAASDDDRDWFRTHPGATRRVRPYVPGEGGAYVPQAGTHSVLVTQHAPGIRSRAFIGTPKQSGNDQMIFFNRASGEVLRVYGEGEAE